MKQTLKYVAVFMVSAAIAFAGTIKVWGTNDVLTASDLNANFSHIHNLMVGGHGARLVDADVSSGAAIAYTKIATNPYVPVAWGLIDATTCTPDGGTCPATGLGITSAVQISPGTFRVTLVSAQDIAIVGGGYATPAECGVQQGANPLLVICSPVPTAFSIVAFNQ